MESNQIKLAFGRVVRKRRVELGLSQDAFADLVGVHRTYCGAIERGERNVSLENLNRIAIGLGVSLGELFAEIEPKP